MSASERLHSVKWYRTDHSGNMEEFYTFQPSRQPPAKTYKRKGIRVDVSREGHGTVCLNFVLAGTEFVNAMERNGKMFGDHKSRVDILSTYYTEFCLSLTKFCNP